MPIYVHSEGDGNSVYTIKCNECGGELLDANGSRYRRTFPTKQEACNEAKKSGWEILISKKNTYVICPDCSDVASEANAEYVVVVTREATGIAINLRRVYAAHAVEALAYVLGVKFIVTTSPARNNEPNELNIEDEISEYCKLNGINYVITRV